MSDPKHPVFNKVGAVPLPGEPMSCFDLVDGAYVPNAEARARQAELDGTEKLRNMAKAALADERRKVGMPYDLDTIT